MDEQNHPPGQFVTYQGFMFFEEASSPTPMTHHHIVGAGRVVGNEAYVTKANQGAAPPDWVRVSISLRGGSHPGALLGLSFHNRGPDSFIGDVIFSLEYDLPSGGVGEGPHYFFKLQHSETGADEFDLNLQQTNLLFKESALVS
jgi:hypothetical protein